MIGRVAWDELSEAVALTGNQVLLLDGAKSVRLVESGAIALFCVDVRDGAPAGPRQLLHRIGSGQAVFSVPSELSHRLRFVVAPIAKAVLREVPLDDFWADGEPRGEVARSLMEEWVRVVSRLLTGYREPELPFRVGPGRDIGLEDGQSVMAERNTVVWCRVREGTVHCMGSAEMPLDARSGRFPLGPDTWVRAAGPARVVTVSTTELDGASDLEHGLAVLHRLALHHLRVERHRAAEAEKARLRQRELMQEERKADALADVAAVLEPRVAVVGGDTPLLRAVAAVGAATGIEISPPMKSETARGQVESVEAIARASRIRARRVTLAGAWWKRDCGSLVGFTADEERRPVALLRGRSMRYEIYDPVEHSRKRVTGRVAAGLASEAWMLYTPLPDGKLGLLDLFRFSVARRGRDLAMVLVTGVIATLLGMITPQATGLLMDDAIPDADRRLLLEIGAALLAAAFGQTVFKLCQGIVLLRVGIASSAVSQAAVWDRLLRLRPSFFRGYSSGDLQSRVTAVSEVGQELSGITLSSLFSAFLALLNLLLLYYYSPALTLLALAVGAVVMVVTLTIGFYVRRSLRELMELDGRLFGLVVQLISGVGKLRVAGAASRAYTQWLKKYGTTLRLWSDAYRLKDRVYLFNQVLPTLSAAALFFLAHDLLVEGRQATVSAGITLGTFLAFNVAFGAFLSGVISLSDTAVSFLDVFAKGRRVRPILEAEPEIDMTKADPGRLGGRLAVSDVQFRYREDGPMILDGVHVRAEPGEFIALVGPSGSGKSTVMRLLLGFETPLAGTVTYDGQDMAKLDVLALRRQIGVVLQGGRVDAGSIFDNIACGDVISLDDAWAAAEDAGIADEIREMPMGMHTIVSVGGGNLSGGQRQRLLIARALAQRPQILLFDEATSALDNRTQAVVSRSLERLNVTRVVIAHRLSTIRNADRIYVLDGGKIVQRGRFEELMAADDSVFARMMRRQVT